METMNTRQLEFYGVDRIPAALGGRSVGVIGDFVIDAYYYIDQSQSEISIETGLRTRAVKAIDIRLGGAGNVARNLASLGFRTVRAYGVVGDDLFGRELVRLCDQEAIDTTGLVTQSERWTTGVYTKPCEDGVEFERLDIGNFNRPDPAVCAEVLRRLEADLPELDVVIVNQQLLSSLHTADVRRRLADLSTRTVLIVDSRHHPDDFGSALRKLNLDEACAVLGRVPDRSGLSDAPGIARELALRWAADVVVTLGADGCVACGAGAATSIPGMHVVGEVDTVGAGDAMTAGLACAIAAGEAVDKAAYFGNLCAGLSVRTRGTGRVYAEEVALASAAPDFRYRPTIAYQSSNRRHHNGSEIEVVTTLPAVKRRIAVFDFDGTISTLRQGWEEVMHAFMIRMILGPAADRVPPAKRESIDVEVRSYIDQSTGIQTITQMKELRQMILRHGFVDPCELREPLWYKERYREELSVSVEARLRKVRDGELSPGDVTIKGALGFLELLSARGFTLYLASGSDEPDIRREAEVLGCAHLFDGGIHGSRNDEAADPKRIVLDRLLSSIDGAAEGLPVITFGDGPVEIR
ncbi:MAG: hypothetical protein EA382_11475, partial [Spirochaetaceae bacterium]